MQHSTCFSERCLDSQTFFQTNILLFRQTPVFSLILE
uniref:Uncharacterized protein n=1 Tax=Anguilla anguilla TaxID=7936 RepID=A0A0E9RI42_ANGAN